MTRKLIFSSFFFLSFAFTLAQKPQEPAENNSYNSEDVTFENKTDRLKLAGTFTYPKDKKNVPVVVLISGSGPQNRNSELLGHKPFLVIADELTKKGIGVLRVDDRGTGASEGIYNESGLAQFANDTKAAVEYLKTRKEINSAKIGLIGHSLGGVIAPMIASESKDIAFIVLLAGSGIRGDKLMLLQKALVERKMGIDESSISIGSKNIGGAYDIIVNSAETGAPLEVKLAAYFTATFGEALPPTQLAAMSKQLAAPWFADFIKLDPAQALSKVKCPTLALIGSNDVQVPAAENLNAIKTTLERSGNKSVTTIELPTLNHLFQESVSGLPQEYATIEQTFSPKALTVLSDWIVKMTK